MAGRRYNGTKKAVGGDRKSEKSKGQIDPLIPSTAAKLAAEIVAGQAKERQGERTDICQKSDNSEPLDTKREIAKAAPSHPPASPDALRAMPGTNTGSTLDTAA